eukprot:4839906-Alexandrium_andersonii.AAC.1
MCDPADYADAAEYAAIAENLRTLPPKKRHRRKIPTCAFPENLFVARPVGKKEILENPKAQAALKVEWDRLRSIGTWDEAAVEEWSVVRKRQHAH